MVFSEELAVVSPYEAVGVLFAVVSAYFFDQVTIFVVSEDSSVLVVREFAVSSDLSRVAVYEVAIVESPKYVVVFFVAVLVAVVRVELETSVFDAIACFVIFV